MFLTRLIVLLNMATGLSLSIQPECQSRRAVFASTVGAAFGLALCDPDSALAAGNPPSPEELSRIKEGYKGIVYLLNNWDAETTTCRENGGECKRDAEPVRRYLGKFVIKRQA